ncbi:putative reverse transcriptase domain-containing protein [Tanacetum coccineum]
MWLCPIGLSSLSSGDWLMHAFGKIHGWVMLPLCSRFNWFFRLRKNQNCLVRDKLVNGYWALLGIGGLCRSPLLYTDGLILLTFSLWVSSDRLSLRLSLSSRGLDIDSILCPLPISGGLFVVGVSLKSRRYLPVMNETYGTPRGKLQKSRKTELIFVKYRLMIPLFPVDAICHVCRKACLDSFGEHAVHCKELSGIKYRHDMVRDVLFNICRRAEISVKKEAHVNFLTDPSDGRSILKPTDVLIFGRVGGKHACVDLTGVSPLVRLSSRGFTAGQAALKAASCKVTKHEKTCIENQHVFTSFAFDTFGFLAPKVVELLSRVQQVMHNNVMTPRSTDVVFKCTMALNGAAPPRGSAAATAANLRRRKTGGTGGASGGTAGNMLQFYTDDAPGLKISPNVVLVMSIGFIAFVAVLHVVGKLYLVGSKA